MTFASGLLGNFPLVSSARAFESEQLDKFLGDLIEIWQLRSPTIIVLGDLPHICLRHQWLICLSDRLDTTELINHLALIHRHRRQDGIIFVGKTGLEKLLRELAEGIPIY